MKRACGILLPVASLPSEYGIGAFSKEAYAFVDQLAAAGQRYWQGLLVMGILRISHLVPLREIRISLIWKRWSRRDF